MSFNYFYCFLEWSKVLSRGIRIKYIVGVWDSLIGIFWIFIVIFFKLNGYLVM